MHGGNRAASYVRASASDWSGFAGRAPEAGDAGGVSFFHALMKTEKNADLLEGEEKSVGKSRILLVDDHPITREGLCALINRQRDLAVCGEADSAPKAIELVTKLAPDFAIIDI